MTDTSHRRLLLLGLLHGTEMHGYQLHVHLSGTGLIGLKKPAAYNLLETMERRGWLDHQDEEQGERTRRIYQLTPSGQDATVELLREQLADDAPPEYPNLVSLFLLDLLEPEEARTLLSRRRVKLERDLAEGSVADASLHAHPGAVGRVLQHVRQVRELELKLLDEVLGSLIES